MDRKFAQLTRNKRLFTAVGTSGVVISSGLLAWQWYNVKRSHEVRGQLEDVGAQRSDGPQPQYIDVPTKVLDRVAINYNNDDIKIDPAETKDDIKSRIPRHLRRPWRLLHQANTGDYETHLRAVRDLSRLRLGEHEVTMLAQAAERRAGVGLARCEGVDTRWFVSVPLPPSVAEGDIIEMFRDILILLPSDDKVHNCTKLLTASALDHYLSYSYERTRDTDISSSFHHESHHLKSIPSPSINHETIVEQCLQAILSHSTIPEHCSVLTQSIALPLFSKVIQTFPSNVRIKSLIGQILANICQSEANHHAVWATGWVGTLATWRSAQQLEVSLPAEKSLANLDVEFGQHTFSPGIYLLGPSDRLVTHTNILSNWGVDVVFVHGLWGGVFFTWRQREQAGFDSGPLTDSDADFSFCWPRDWLIEGEGNVRLLGCDFDSYLSQWGDNCPTQNFKRSLDERSEDMLEGLVRAGVGSRPVIFVGHSMGGLIIKKMLLLAQASANQTFQSLAENTKGVVFYSTPHEGSEIAKMNTVMKYIIFPSVEVQELEIDNPALTSLNECFKQFVARFKTRVISFGETQPTRHLGMDIKFVPEWSADPGVGEFHAVPYNHIDICKPENVKSILYRKLSSLMWDCLDDASPFLQ